MECEKKAECGTCNYYRACFMDMGFLKVDSYIEERFYLKCHADKKCGVLLLEWMDSKDIYAQYSGLTQGDYENYSKHDASHSVAILNAIASVLGKDKIDRMNATDLWMMLHCAYGHDIGMPYGYEETKALWKNIEREKNFQNFIRECRESDDEDCVQAAEAILAISEKIKVEILNSQKKVENVKFDTGWPAEIGRHVTYLMEGFIRQSHAERSKKVMERCEALHNHAHSQVEMRFYKAIAKCCIAHGNDLESVSEDIDKLEWSAVEGTNAHPRFIAYLLRMGDLLDIGNNRFDPIVLEHYGELEEKSQLHKDKHEAIDHIVYTDQQIEVTAHSDNEAVCQLTNDWLCMLKDEVRYLIMHWSEFAPPELGGCTLSEPITKVFYKNELFYRIKDAEFKVNKKTLIDLVIGRNLYLSEFDFMREYIQNALDASKMRFWIDIKDGNLDFFIEDERKAKPTYRDRLLPFDFKTSIFENYGIDIIFEYVANKNGTQGDMGIIHIEIIDRGIGIDGECVNAISQIGSGWKRRKKYAAYLDTMPRWLQPTGGFGIGMQSGFMITDRIEIETRCEEDRCGRWIGLYSNKNNGRIEQREGNVRALGTKICVDVPYTWFMDRENYRDYPQLSVGNAKLDDFMDPKVMIGNIADFIESYVKVILGNSLFPVKVRQKGFRTSVIQGFGVGAGQKWTEFKWKEQIYKITELSEDKGITIVIWDSFSETLCRIALKDNLAKDEEYSVNWFFKGVKVWTDLKENDDAGICQYIGNFDIDIMGMKVKECLTIDRNRFNSRFDYREMSNRYAMVCLEYLAMNERLIRKSSAGIVLLRCLLAYRFISDEAKGKVRDALDEFDEVEIQKMMGNTDAIVFKLSHENVSGEEDARTMSTLLEMCRDFYSQKALCWGTKIKEDAKHQTDGNKKRIDIINEINERGHEYMWAISSKFNELADILLKMLGEYYGDNRTVMDDEWKLYDYKDENERIQTKKKYGENDVFKMTPGRRDIFYVDEDIYPELHVSKIPFNDLSENPGNLGGDNVYMIISPIPAIFSDNDMVVVYKDKEDPESSYMEWVTGNSTFEMLVNWVYKYQKEEGRYDMDKIEKAYRKLITYLYEKNVKKKIEQYQGKASNDE